MAGISVGLGFAPTDLWWLVVPGIAVFLVVVKETRPKIGLVYGYLFGFALAMTAFRWTSVLGLPVLAVVAAWLAIWYALVGLVVAASRNTAMWGFLGVATWMAGEWLGARFPFGGFGWGRLAYTTVGTPLDGFFPLISATGVSLIIISTAFLLAWAVSTLLKTAGVSRNLIVPSVCFGVALLVGLAGLLGRTYDPAPDSSEVTIGVVQGNVPGMGISAIGSAYTMDHNHLSETILLAAKVNTGQVPAPDFIVWPENSTATDPFVYPRTAQIIDLAVDIIQTPILVGTISHGPGIDERQTTALWYDQSGEVAASYHKRNLVPFGEWVPFKSVLVKVVPILEYVGAQSVPGTTVGVLNVEVANTPRAVGVLICFELAYDSTFDDVILGDQTTTGAHVVVVQTSNAMFTGSTQMAQQDRITRVRAMESRREILIATTNSLAGLVDTHGRVVYAAELRTSDSQVFTVPTRTQVTPAVVYRTWFDLGAVLLPLLGAGIAFTIGRKKTGESHV
jgi:apolipoprotein N-acyltransferase